MRSSAGSSTSDWARSRAVANASKPRWASATLIAWRSAKCRYTEVAATPARAATARSDRAAGSPRAGRMDADHQLRRIRVGQHRDRVRVAGNAVARAWRDLVSPPTHRDRAG